MYSLEVYIQNERLDLFKDETVSLNSSVQNIKDISKVFSDFTKSFTVPTSKKNNKIFKHWYNSDITGGFNASIRQEAELKLNGVRYKLGKIQLESVKLKNGIAENYKITFYGELINLTDLFADDLLSELNLSAYNHDYDFNNVIDGLQNGIKDGNIIYPLISSERNWDYNSPTVANEIKYNASIPSQGINYRELKPAIKINRIIEAIEAEYEVTFTNNFFKNTTNSIDELFMWLNGTVAGNIGANSLTVDWNGGDSDNVNFTTDIGTFTTFGTVSSNQRISWGQLGVITAASGYENVSYTFKVYNDEDLIYESFRNNGLQIEGFFFGIDGTVSGEQIWNLRIEVESDSEFIYTSAWQQKEVVNGATINTYTTLGSSQTITDDLQIGNNLPNIKLADFFKGLVKMFNLVIEPLSYTSFNIDTLDSWYLDGGNKNLTEYVDVESYDINKPKLYKNINFKYEEAEAIVGYNFFDTNKVGYGDLEAEFNVDGGTLDIKVPFENMLMEKLTDTTTGAETNIQVGSAFDKDLKPVVLPPILFFNRGSVDTGQYIGFLDENGTSTKISNYLNVGAESSVIDGASEMSLNFGSEMSSWNLTTQSASLFNTFWRDYITDLYDSKRREYVYKANLPLKILNKLKLNDLIEIRGKNYIINSLDINLTSGDVKLNLLNYIGGALTAKTIGTLLANLSGTSTMLARINQVSTLSMFAELVGTSELLATLDTAITPTLQEVTDAGDITTNDINANSFINTTSDDAFALLGGGGTVLLSSLGGGATDLQSVTDIGNTTTNVITVSDGIGSSNIYAGTINVIDNTAPTSHFLYMQATTAQIGAYNGTSSKSILQFPAATQENTYTLQNSSGTLAFLSDIVGGGSSGTVTNVTAGNGMTQSGTSTINPTLNVIGGNGISSLVNNIQLTTLVSSWNAGTVYTITANDFILGSDKKLKTKIEDIRYKEIKSNYQQFEFKKVKGIIRYGVIAQELEKTNPEFVSEANGIKQVSYIDLHSAEIHLLKKENKQIKEDLNDLKKLVQELINNK